MNKKVIISIIAVIAVIALVYFVMKRNKAQEAEQVAQAAQAAEQKPVIKDEKAVKGGYFGAGDPTITPTKTNDFFTSSVGEKERWEDFNFLQKSYVYTIPGFFSFQKNN